MSFRNLVPIVRYLLGFGFVLFGLNGFLHFLPQPPAPAAAMSFAGALFATGYMFPLIKSIEIAAGLLLLSNRWVPLALTLLAPLLVNIVAFHLFLAPAGLAIPILFLAAELYLAWSYRDAYVPMLRARVEPKAAPAKRVAPRTASAAA
ncbi:MAG TPA: DoxX family protein [Polyangiales bacterium]|nr:DoxX family protein [Polyangiales bacterium]